MPFEITMPQLGLTMERGTVVEWLAGEGDEISAGQEIFSVETDKAVVAVEAHQGGILARILVPEGQEVAVGAVVAVGVAPGETLPAGWQPDQPAATPPLPEPSRRETPATAQPAAPGPLAASWKARAMAREAGLDLAALVGGGPGGRIVAADVETALAAQAASRGPRSGPPPRSPGIPAGRGASPEPPNDRADPGRSGRGARPRARLEAPRPRAPSRPAPGRIRASRANRRRTPRTARRTRSPLARDDRRGDARPRPPGAAAPPGTCGRTALPPGDGGSSG